MQLTDIKEIKGKIILRSGLHIGAGDMEMQIGGTDNAVIKHPHTQEPYIPGSSLKGKVRSLLELKTGLMQQTGGKPLQAGDLKNLSGEELQQCTHILKLFGYSGADGDEAAAQHLGPTRVSFADCPLTERYRQEARAKRLTLTEVKSENSIHRIKGTAESPRFTERVPAEAEFEFSVNLKILDPAEEDLFETLLQVLKLLQMDALGGSTSRGYGRIRFEFYDAALQARFAAIEPFDNGGRSS